MKKIYALFLAIIIPFIGIDAQKPINVTSDSIAFGISKYPGIIVTIPEVNMETVQKDWVKSLQSGTKSKVVTENEEMTILGANIKEISKTSVNVFSKIMNQDSLVQLSAIIELKKDVYAESGNEELEFTAAKNYLKEFAKSEYIALAKDQLQVEEKKLKDLENELSSLKNDKSKEQKSIKSNKDRIQSEKDNISEQNAELAKLEAELINQNAQLEAMDEGVAKDEKQKFIKELEKQKNKLTKKIGSSEKKITKAESQIEDSYSSIPQIESSQDDIRTRISNQEAVRNRYAEKLNTIKGY
jgi:chromosome segregation ATPase